MHRGRFVLVFSLCLAALSCRTSNVGRVRVDLTDRSGLTAKPLDRLEAGDSLTLGLTGLEPKSQVELHLNDDLGKEWSYARLFADDRGRVAPQLFWYQSGVIGTTSRNINFKPDPAFVTFEEAETYFAQHPLTLTVRDANRRVLTSQTIKIGRRTTPMIYPSNAEGVLQNSLNARTEDLYVTGVNFAPGSTVHLAAIDNQYLWNLGDAYTERSKRTIKLDPGQTKFTTRLWGKGEARPGAYDLLARVGDDARRVLTAGDVLSFNEDTGVVFYIIVNGNIVIESAGRERNAPAKFEFSDSFEKGENVWAAVDPTDVPAVHSGGNYAAYWVVDHQGNAYWDGVSPALTDMSGGVEIQRVKYWCINMSRRIVWPAATQMDPIKAYDLIVDFGSVPANVEADFVHDNVYTKGTDFIDGYNTDAGFWVGENPGTAGSFHVGRVDLDQPSGISGIPVDPSGLTAPNYPITLAWARIMYPATSPGIGTAIASAGAPYPVALFLHGRHAWCDSNGAALGGSSQMSCSGANRVPSHEGYDYIMERLASQGFFCISISAHEIQFDDGDWNYWARGQLILKFLDKLKDWNMNGTDPFGGMFASKIDMTRIGLSGHSRGGEGVVAAEVLNQSLATPYSILAVNAIAPTDQEPAASWVPQQSTYYMLVGARDGDVIDIAGFRTYDRAYPDGVLNRPAKAAGLLYRANHNYFNTIWTNTPTNGWVGASDDWAAGVPKLTPAEQRDAALATVTAFFRWRLQGVTPYREVLTGRVEPATVVNQHLFWTFQDGERKAVDNFEQPGAVATSNTISGTNAFAGLTTSAERRLNQFATDYSGGPPADGSFYHDTLGLKAQGSGGTITIDIPPGSRDFSAYTHLTMRVGKKVTVAGTGPDINLNVQLEDGAGNTALWPLQTDQFDRIPHPYESPEAPAWGFPVPVQLNGVRIPLRNFTQNNSGVILSDIARIIITVPGGWDIGIDDIEFGK